MKPKFDEVADLINLLLTNIATPSPIHSPLDGKFLSNKVNLFTSVSHPRILLIKLSVYCYDKLKKFLYFPLLSLMCSSISL